MADPIDANELARLITEGRASAKNKALLDSLLSGHVDGVLGAIVQRSPQMRPVPAEVLGFRVRLDLQQTTPPVWRRLELPGDLTLPRVHDVIQAAMGWTNSHLHRFRTGRDHRSPAFVTPFDVDDGDDGMLEDDVRLDQLVAAPGDSLWYEYDFGDGWEHVLTVEAVLEGPPSAVRCLGGRMACPPEDCGGVEGYAGLATWVRDGYDDARLPDPFEDADEARDWLPAGWHPDHFDLDEVNAALTLASADPVVAPGELGEMVAELDRRGDPRLREVLRRPGLREPGEVSDDDAARMTEPYRVLLELVGDGVGLTPAGYLPPALVEQLALRTGVTNWWIGKANREDLTPPVAAIRESARDLGLISVRQRRLTPTAAGRRCGSDARALWRHVVGRLPLGRGTFERQAGWSTLAVVGSGAPEPEWHAQTSGLLFAVGWRSGGSAGRPPDASSPTLTTLEQLAGAPRTSRRYRPSDVDAVAATARAVLARPAVGPAGGSGRR